MHIGSRDLLRMAYFALVACTASAHPVSGSQEKEVAWQKTLGSPS